MQKLINKIKKWLHYRKHRHDRLKYIDDQLCGVSWHYWPHLNVYNCPGCSANIDDYKEENE